MSREHRGASSGSPPGMFAGALLIARKDLLIEWRTRSAFLSATSFSVLGLLIFYFAWDTTAVSLIDLAPGALWVIFTFSGLLALHRSFGSEQVTRAIDALLAAPVQRESIFLGKALANAVFVLAIQVVAVPLALLFYNIPVGGMLFPLTGIIVLATIGLAVVGTLFSAMAVDTRIAELLLPLLALPFFVPVVICAAQSTAMILSGRPVGDAAGFVRLLAVFDIVAAVICTLVYPSLIEQ